MLVFDKRVPVSFDSLNAVKIPGTSNLFPVTIILGIQPRLSNEFFNTVDVMGQVVLEQIEMVDVAPSFVNPTVDI